MAHQNEILVIRINMVPGQSKGRHRTQHHRERLTARICYNSIYVCESTANVGVLLLCRRLSLAGVADLPVFVCKLRGHYSLSVARTYIRTTRTQLSLHSSGTSMQTYIGRTCDSTSERRQRRAISVRTFGRRTTTWTFKGWVPKRPRICD